MYSCTFYGVASLGRVSKQPRTSKNMRKLEKRSKARRSKTCQKDIQVGVFNPLPCLPSHSDSCPFRLSEEFGIYLNYVRKLGFEETPDYEFLRELFSKVLKNMGEVEDAYDWQLLNSGKGWEAGVSSH